MKIGPDNNFESVNRTDDEIDLKDLLIDLWRHKVFIGLVSITFFAVAVLFASTISDKYRSTALLAPTNSSGGGAMPVLNGGLGNLASLAGLNIGSVDGAGKTAMAIELIKTWGFLEDVIEKNNLQSEVFAVTGWNKDTNELLYNEDIFDKKHAKWTGSYLTKNGPSSWELYDRMVKKIIVTQDKRSGFIRLSVDHVSPHIARRWVDILVQDINQFTKARDREEAFVSIKYLKQQIEVTDIEEMRSIFYQLIEEQTKTLMLAEISDEYVLKTISAARASEQKIGPNRLGIILLGGGLGFTMSVLIVFLICFFRQRPKSDNPRCR